jgi:D-alanyl-D-alanine carboxypeptidase (penicillin-binding protein 5/6)
VLLAALLASVALAAPAHAKSDDPAVGGDRLASDEVVVDPAAPPLPDVQAESWLVADVGTGEVLAAKDAHGRYAPASTLKTLTALALIPVLDPARRVVPTFEDVNVEGSKVGLVERVGYPVDELFSALMMVSGNDAANALATAAGGQHATAELMNETARSLGAYDTHAVNPHGLDADGQLSSAYDLALIARAGLQDEAFARYAATRRSSVSAPGGARIEIYNKNKLLQGYEGALGIKNGFTSRARASFVGAAEREGRRLVVTLMKADPRVFDEATKLLDWGFAATAARPVGELVAAPEEQAVPAESTVAARHVAAGTGDGGDSGLPAAFGGAALAAAALLTVRRPAPPRPVPARSVPAQRASAARRGAPPVVPVTAGGRRRAAS